MQNRSPEVCLLKKYLHFLQNTNAVAQARQTAGARDERTLCAVACSRLILIEAPPQQTIVVC
jgi:hypothetical protein